MIVFNELKRRRNPPTLKALKVWKKVKPRLKILAVFLLTLVSLIYYVPGVFAEEVREDCRLCGMWIDQYMHTRHVLTEADGTQVSFCSFTCAVKFMKMHEVEVKQLKVADYLSTELVDVKDAFYLLESDAPPVMSNSSIIAFASKKTVESFQKLHGGKIMTFDEILALH
jgi:nitrous oxide reductase accessory protein NosL